MTFAWNLPSIGAIQRTNVILVAITAAMLAYFVSAQAALGCILGGAVVIANLFALAVLGSLALAVASGGASSAAKFGTLAIPLKLFVVVGLVYLVFTRALIDGLGFGFGVLTQMTAIIIETGRASLRGGVDMRAEPVPSASGEDTCQSQ
jgi:small-conductance mechanosensitive channel